MNRLDRLVAIAVLAVVAAVPAHADPGKCQKTVLSALRKFKKVYLKAQEKCLDAENLGKIPGPCPDATATSKIQITGQKAVDKIDTACSASDVAAIGYTDCAFESATAGAEGGCAGLAVGNGAQLAQCLECWKASELSEFLAILYASHASETCGGDLGESSPVCSDLDCTTPLPDQRNLGDTGENDCQKAIGKAGIKYLLTREKLLEKCALIQGATEAGCLNPQSVIAAGLQKAETKKMTTIKNKCGNRQPTTAPSFCCRTGTGNQCTAAATREDCLAISGASVQEGKFCDVGNTCSPVTGGGQLTWWTSCPETTTGTCPGTTVGSINDLIDCVDAAANAAVEEMLCEQIRLPAGAWPCPPSDGSPSGAFVD